MQRLLYWNHQLYYILNIELKEGGILQRKIKGTTCNIHIMKETPLPTDTDLVSCTSDLYYI